MWLSFQCSVSCGSGIQVRSVECLRSQGLVENCDNLMRPISTQPCSIGIACITNSSESTTMDEESIDVMSQDDPSSYLTHFYAELPKPERLVDQHVPSEAT